MAYTQNQTTKEAINVFQKFDSDTQLALLWYGYLDLKDQLHPENANSAEVVADALYHQIQAMPQEQQLQAQRDIVSKANTDISRAYTALGTSARIQLWLSLAQGMDEGSVSDIPDDYELPSETDQFVSMMKELEFEERINFMRSVCMDMGAPSN